MKNPVLPIAVAVGMVAACSPVAGTPVVVPASSGTTTTAPAPVTPSPLTPVTEFVSELPEVADPLDVRPWAMKVCDLLTDGEAAVAGVGGPGKADGPSEQGGECLRTAGRASLNLTVFGRVEMVTLLLDGWERGRTYLGRTEVAGYPAFAAAPAAEPAEVCEVGVLVAEGQSVHVEVDGLDGACEHALVAAEYVVRRITG